MPDVLMPRLSDTMTEGVLSHWLKNEGDEIHRGDILAEIETDKSTMDLEAYEDGTLTKILVAEGSTVPIGEPVAVIGEPSGPDAPAETGPEHAAAPASAGEPATVPTPVSSPASGSSTAATPADVRVRATPLVRSLARERGIDLSTVHGTGPAGRIIRADLDDLDTAGAATQPTATSPPDAPAHPVPTA
ncbi:MAG: E3 binding domain-containing protein, partial [Humibacillus sp.]|nr:E3 binding domain-containing protein [Humibacillus sp.]